MSGGWVLYRRQEAELEFLGDEDWVSQLPRAMVLSSLQVARAMRLEVAATCLAPVEVVPFDEARLLAGVTPAVRESMAGELEVMLRELSRWVEEGVQRSVLSSFQVEQIELVKEELVAVVAGVRRG